MYLFINVCWEPDWSYITIAVIWVQEKGKVLSYMDRLCFPFFWADAQENKEMGSLVIQGNSHVLQLVRL